VDTVNNKGRFKDDEPGKKIKLFFKESGFYIAIVVGLCALAAGAVYFSTNQILSDPEPDPYYVQEEDLNEDDDIGFNDFIDPFGEEEPDQSSIVDEGTPYFEDDPLIGMDDIEDEPVTDVDIDETVPDPDTDVIYEEKEPGPKEEASVATTGKAQAEVEEDAATEDVVLAIVRPGFQAPVAGKIQAEYSMDKLIFSPTFNEWRTHSGVDIAAPRGEAVRAVGNGVVLEIKNDPRYGFTVVIDHKNGYKSVYSNLASDQTLQVGQEVKQGDPIGAVGATAIFESAEPTHLHFELYKENKLVDPAVYIDFAK
jgi:hypothetical protein